MKRTILIAAIASLLSSGLTVLAYKEDFTITSTPTPNTIDAVGPILAVLVDSDIDRIAKACKEMK